MSEPELHVEDHPTLSVARLLVASALEGESIVLTGGATVGEAYEEAARLEPLWPEASLWWSDERCVPPDDERSNYALVKRTLLDTLALKPAEVHRMRGELPPPEAADLYERELERVTLDFLLLALGPDGHVASLFPGSPQLAVRDRLVTSGPAGLEPFVDRVTLTLPALLSAHVVVFLVTGAHKAEAVRRAFREPISDDVPASLLRTGDAPLIVYLDRAAAGS